MQNKSPDIGVRRKLEGKGLIHHPDELRSPKRSGAMEKPSSNGFDLRSALYRLTAKAVTFHKTDDFLTEVIAIVRDGLGYNSAMICLVDASKMELDCRVCAGNMENFGKPKRQTLSVEMVKKLMQRGKRVSRSYRVSTDIEKEEGAGKPSKSGQGKRSKSPHGVDDTIFVPIMNQGDEMIGLFAVHHGSNRNAPSVETIEILEIFSNITGAALQKADLEKEAIETKSFLANLTSYTQDAIFTVDLDGTIRMWNAGAETLYGYRREEVIHRHMDEILSLPEQKGRLKSLIKEIAEQEGPIGSDITRIGKDGRIRLVNTTCFPYTDAEGYLTGLTIIDRDMSHRKSLGDELKRASDSLRHELKIAGRQHLKTLRLIGSVQKENVGLERLIDKVRRAESELKVSNKKLEELSILDDLTKLSNRRHLNRMLGEEMKRSNRFKRPMAFIMMDIDRFKEYNDTFGHVPGDTILKELAQLLLSNVREIDFVSRYGGDEFCILLPETDADDGIQQAERIRDLVDAYPFEGQESVPGENLTVSVGVAVYPEDARSKVKIIEYADRALYAAKKSGGNCVVRYETSLGEYELVQTEE